MSEQNQNFSLKEMLEMQMTVWSAQFVKLEQFISKENGELRAIIAEHSKQSRERSGMLEVQIQKLDTEVKDLRATVQLMKEEQVAHKVKWGIFGTFGGAAAGLVTAFVFNKIF